MNGTSSYGALFIVHKIVNSRLSMGYLFGYLFICLYSGSVCTQLIHNIEVFVHSLYTV